MRRERARERESEIEERREIKGRLPTHHRSAIFFGSIVKSNGRINRGKGASA